MEPPDKNLIEKTKQVIASNNFEWIGKNLLTDAEDERLGILGFHDAINSLVEQYHVVFNAFHATQINLAENPGLNLDASAVFRSHRDRMSKVKISETGDLMIKTLYIGHPVFLQHHKTNKKSGIIVDIEVEWLKDNDPFQVKFPYQDKRVSWEDFWQLRFMPRLSTAEVKDFLFGRYDLENPSPSPTITLRYNDKVESRPVVFTAIYLPIIRRLIREKGIAQKGPEEERDFISEMIAKLWELLSKKALVTWNPNKGSFGGYIRKSLEHALTSEKRKSHRKKRGDDYSHIPFHADEASDRDEDRLQLAEDTEQSDSSLEIQKEPDEKELLGHEANQEFQDLIRSIEDTRMLEIVKQIYYGIPQKKIAANLGISPPRLNQLLKSLKDKSNR